MSALPHGPERRAHRRAPPGSAPRLLARGCAGCPPRSGRSRSAPATRGSSSASSTTSSSAWRRRRPRRLRSGHCKSSNARLVPLIPFNAVCYAAGLVPRPHQALRLDDPARHHALHPHHRVPGQPLPRARGHRLAPLAGRRSRAGPAARCSRRRPPAGPCASAATMTIPTPSRVGAALEPRRRLRHARRGTVPRCMFSALSGVLRMRRAAPSSGRVHHGDVRPWLLLLIRLAPAHGYDLRAQLRRHGVEADGPTVYRTLWALEGDGFVRAYWDERSTGRDRRIYHITGSGELELDRCAKEIAHRRRRLSRFLRQHRSIGSVDGPEEPERRQPSDSNGPDDGQSP